MHDKQLTLGRLEAAVLNVLWARGESTVAEVLDALPPGKERHYNTCSTVLTRLAKRGLVGREERGRVLVYRALVTRDELGRAYLEVVRRDVFGGSLLGMVTALLGAEPSATGAPASGAARGVRADDASGRADAAEIRRLLDELTRAERRAAEPGDGG